MSIFCAGTALGEPCTSPGELGITVWLVPLGTIRGDVDMYIFGLAGSCEEDAF
jgi:hypothetical protein